MPERWGQSIFGGRKGKKRSGGEGAGDVRPDRSGSVGGRSGNAGSDRFGSAGGRTDGRRDAGREVSPWERLSEVLRSVLCLLLILECNSLFVNSVLVDSGQTERALLIGGIALAGVLLLGGALRERRPDREGLGLLAVLYLVLVLFWAGNVRLVDSTFTRQDYWLKFGVLLPELILLLRQDRRRGRPFVLPLRYADLVLVLAAGNLLVYLTVSLSSTAMPSDVLRTRWSDLGRLRTLINYFNLAALRVREGRVLLGRWFYRNNGFFPEPLMYGIPLLTALSAEMFLRPLRERRLYRWLLLSLCLVTTQSTLGMMLLLVLWGMKLWSLFPSRGRVLTLVPVLVVLAAGIAWLFAVKLGSTVGGDMGSTAVHLQDYVLGLRAFLRHPLLGGGYDQGDVLRALMSERRLSHNTGLSNSVAVVLAEGGMVLGALCICPFVLLMSRLRHRAGEGAAFFGTTALLLYCVTIFHFRMLLLLFMALGYSLVDVRRVDGHWQLSLAVPRTRAAHRGKRDSRRERLRRGKEDPRVFWRAFWCVFSRGLVPALCIFAAALLLSVHGRVFWQGLYRFMMGRQLYLRDSVWMVIFFWIWLILLLSPLVPSPASRPRGAGRALPLLRLGASLLWTIVVLRLLPVLYSRVHTDLLLSGSWSDLAEKGSLFFWALAGLVLVQLLLPALAGRGRERRRCLLLSAALCAVLVPSSSVSWQSQERAFAGAEAQEELAGLENFFAQARELEDVEFTVDDLPEVFARRLGKVQRTLCRTPSLSIHPDSAVLCRWGTDLQELFESGYQIAYVGGKYFLYTNSESLIRQMQERGYIFYRYYPVSRSVSLPTAAKRNHLSLAEDGSVVIPAGGKLTKGPWHAFYADKYTVTYRLQVDPQVLQGMDPQQKVCRLTVVSDFGKETCIARWVRAGEFDQQGSAVKAMEVTLDQVEGVAYQLRSRLDAPLRLRAIDVTHTAEVLTVRRYDFRQQVREERYYGRDGHPYARSLGQYGVRYARDEVGRITRTTYLGADGKEMMIGAGYCAFSNRFDERGQCIEELYYDTRGKRVRRSGGFSGMRYEYDSAGHLIRLWYLDSGDHRVAATSGYAQVRRWYDAHDQIRRQEFDDADGNPVTGPDGFAIVRRRCDEDGHVLSERYFDAQGEPVLCLSGYARFVRTVDANGDAVAERYYDAEGKPTRANAGNALVRRTYDDDHNVISESYFDEAGEPVSVGSGCAQVRRSYDESDRKVGEAYLDAQGERTLLRDGYSAVRITYDAYSAVSSIVYLDTDDQPVTTRYGYAALRRIYNDRRQLVKEEYFDEKGEPVLCRDGYAAQERSYSDSWELSGVRYLGLSGETVIGRGGYAQARYTSDAQHRRIREEYYGTDGKRITLAAGYSGLSFTRDAAGNAVLLTCLDERNRPVTCARGYMQVRRSHNARHQLVTEEYLDADGQPVACTDGTAQLQYIYGQDGRLSLVRSLDLQGKVIGVRSGDPDEEEEE